MLDSICVTMCCRGSGCSARCVVVLCSAQDGREQQYLLPQYMVSSVPWSEISSLAPCGCVMAGTSQGLGHDLTPTLIINVLCQKWRLLGGSADVLYW